MNEITIYNADGTPLMGNVPVTADAVHEENLMQTDQVNLKWNAATSTILPAGSFVVLNNIRYYLAEDYQPDSKDLGLYTYTPEFVHEVYLLKKMPFLLINATNNASSIESDWNYTGSLNDLCQPLEQAINDALGINGASPQAYSVQIDAAIENAVSLSFSNMSILDALNAIAEAVNGEWYTDEAINGYTGNHIIHIAPSCLHEGGESSTLAFTAGNQVGFPQSQQKHEFYNRYYIFGATRNIPQDYNGAQANTVVNKRLTLDPTLHPNGYIDLPQFTEEGEIVTTDDSTKPSFYDENGNVAHYVPDDSLSGRKFVKVVQIDDVYPRANLHVSSIVANTRYVLQDGNKVQTGTDGGGNPVYSTYVVYYVSLQNESSEAFTIDDSTYDPTSNPNGSRIKGLNVSIHFKSGALTGREFEVKYHSAASQQENIDGTKVNIPAGCFEIVKIEDNTVIIPNTNIAPVVDDEVIVFNIRMPQAYITSAYKELDKEAMKAIYEEWRDGNEYEVKSNPVYFTQNEYNLHIGRHVKLTAWGRLIDTRITKLQTHLDRPFEQTISFSKGIKKGTISTLLTTIEATSARMTQVELKDDSNLHQLRQQLYTAQRELQDMVFDTEGNYYSDKISPVAIETKLIEVGGKSTQLSISGLTVMPNINSAGTAKDPDHVKVVSNSGRLVHYGLPESPRTWNISNSSTYCEIDLSSADAYYIYARCVKATGANACVIVFDQTQHVYDEAGDYYYFLIGTISSKISDGNTPPSYDRVVSLMYGSTSISGRFIQTGRIQSVDGNTYFDLDTGELHGDFTFTSAQKEELAADAASRVQVGGRNYLLNSDGSSSAKITLHGNATLATLDGVKCVKADQNTASCGFYVSTSQMSSAINDNTTDAFDWVLSVDVYASAANIDCQWGFGYGERETITTVGAWHRLTKTVKSNLKTFVVYKTNNNGTLYFKNWKLERGTVATDWTPAPEDETQAMADLASSLEGLEEQIDGKIDTYFYGYKPTTSNAPASGWSSTEKTEHTDDLFYDTATGNVYRWTGSKWERVQDSQIQEALDNASTAQATADGKMQVFSTTPTPPYKEGDMWVQGANGDIKYCSTARASGAFVASDWVVASKYTDDTEATKAKIIASAAPNIYPDHNFDYTSWWSLGNSYSGSETSPSGGGIRLITGRDTRGSYSFHLESGHTYKLSVWAQRIAGSLPLHMSLLWSGQTSGTSYSGYGGTLTAEETSGNWTRYSRILKPDDIVTNPTSATPYFQLDQDSSATDTQWIISDYVIEDYTAKKAADDAASAAAAANRVISEMDGDTYFSKLEKKAYRPTWESISGVNRTNTDLDTISNGSGSYHKVKAAAVAVGISTSDATYVALGQKVYQLRTFLNSNGLYVDGNTAGFVQTDLGTYTKEYYNAEEALWNAIAEAQAAAAVGENLLDNSYKVDLSSAPYSSSTAVADTITLDGIVGINTSTTKQIVVTFPSLTVGAKYVFSFYYSRSYSARTLKVVIGSENLTVSTVADTNWRRFTFTFTATASTTRASIFINESSDEWTVWYTQFQLEKNVAATSWKMSKGDEAKAASQRYLSDALAEARANVGGTEIDGGLVLSKFIGVRDNSDNVVAGMTATKDANGNKMPMIFAGAVSSNQALRLGKFQVWENGKIVSTNGTNEVHIDEDYIKFYNSGNLKNVITSAAGGGITAMSGKATTSDSTTIAPSYSVSDAGSFTQGSLKQEFITKTIAGKTDTITFVSSPTKSGTINVAAGSIKFYTSTSWEYPITEVSGGAISIKLYSGATVIATLATGTLNAATNNVTLSWNAQNNIAFTANNVLKLVISWNQWQVNLPTIDIDEGVSKPYTISRSYQAQSNIAVSWALNEYKNTFYADGFFLSAASNKSFGVDPAMADTEQNLFRIQAPTTGTATQTFCMRPKGLGYSAGSSSLFPLNPLALIVRVTWGSSAGAYGATTLYNPRGVTAAATVDGSNCRVAHGLGISNYTVNVMIRNSNSSDARRAGVQVNIQSTYAIVNIGDVNNSWRADFDIFFYDYSTL